MSQKNLSYKIEPPRAAMDTREIIQPKKKLIKTKALSAVVRINKNELGEFQLSRYDKEDGKSWRTTPYVS